MNKRVDFGAAKIAKRGCQVHCCKDEKMTQFKVSAYAFSTTFISPNHKTMKPKHLTLLVAIFLSHFFSPTKVAAQSWSYFTLVPNTDTIADKTVGVVADAGGNTYWVSHFYVANTLREGYMLTKLNKFGAVESRALLSTGIAGAIILPVKDIKLIAGSLYLLFDFQKTGLITDIDVCVQKYDLNLSKKWQAIYNNAISKNDAARKITEGPSGGILVALTSFQDGLVINYSRATGAVIAQYLYDNGPGTREEISGLVNVNGSVYIGGTNIVQGTTSTDMFIARLDSNLTPVWNKTNDASGLNTRDELTDMCADLSGDILVTGNFIATNGLNRVFFTKYNDVNGTRLWIRRLVNDDVFAKAIFSDGLSNAVSVVNGTPCRYVNVNGVNGGLIASKGIFTSAVVGYQIEDVAYSNNEMYLSGNYDTSFTSAGNQVLEVGTLVSKLNSAGNRIWNEKVVSNDPQKIFAAGRLFIRSSSRVYFICNVDDPAAAPKNTYSIYSNISASTGNRTGVSDRPQEQLLSVYPNPAEDRLSLQTSVEEATDYLVEIINAEGKRCLQNRVSGDRINNGFSIDVSSLPSGIYIVRLSGDSEMRTSRFVRK